MNAHAKPCMHMQNGNPTIHPVCKLALLQGTCEELRGSATQLNKHLACMPFCRQALLQGGAAELS